MALNLGALYVNLGANTGGLTRAERHAHRFARNTEQHMHRAARAANQLRVAFAGIISLAGLRRAVMMADAFNILEQRIRTATRATGGFETVYRQLYDSANLVGTSFETGVKLFQRLSRAAPELGSTNTEMTQLTETVQKLGIMSGSSSEAMKFGLLQFSQGISSVIFRAEEMNSVMENLPELAVRIARGMGLTIGEMRKQIIDGELSSRAVYKSLTSQTRQIAEEFKEMPMTIARAYEQIKNSFASLLNQWDELSGMTAWIADILIVIGAWFRKDHTEGMNQIVEVMAQIRESFTEWKRIVDDTDGMFDSWVPALKFIGKAILDLPVVFRYAFHAIAETGLRHRTIMKTYFKNMKLDFEIVLKEMGLAWTHVANYMGETFVKFANSFRILWADTLSLIASGMARIPGLTDMAAKLESFAQGMKNSALAGTEAFVKANQEAEKAIGKEIAMLELRKEVNNELKDNVVSASLARQEAYADEARATLQQWENNKKARAEARAHEKELAAARKVALAPFITRMRLHEEANIAKHQLSQAEKRTQDKIKELEKSLSKERDVLEKGSSTKLELENKRYEAGLETLNKSYLFKLISAETYNSMMVKLERSHAENLAKIAEQNAPKKDAAWEQRLKKAIDALRALEKTVATERELLNWNYQQQLFDLDQAELLKIETIIGYDELKLRLREDYHQRLAEIDDKARREDSKLGATAALVGFKLQDAVEKQSLADRGKALKNQIDQAAQHSKEAFELQKAFALATALIDAPASILSAYKFGSAFGGPVGGAIAAAVSASAVAVQVAAIQASRFSGNKATGGDVHPGGMYRVNENGPEMLSSGGKDYLMMGNKGGNITPNPGSSGGMGANVIVNVFPQPGESARVEQRQDGDNTQIDVFIEAIEDRLSAGVQKGNSPLADAMQDTYGLNRRSG